MTTQIRKAYTLCPSYPIPKVKSHKNETKPVDIYYTRMLISAVGSDQKLKTE